MSAVTFLKVIELFFIQAQVSDFTGSSWVTLFHEEAQKLLGVDAEVIGSMIDENNDAYKVLPYSLLLFIIFYKFCI